jgi:hypothetical protein
MLNVSLELRPCRITTLTYAYLDPDTDAECAAEWTGPFEAALARGIEVLGAQRCEDGRFAWYAEETQEAYLSTDETVAELGAAHIDFGLYGERSADLYSLWCAGDFDSEVAEREQLAAPSVSLPAETHPGDPT